VEEVIWGKIQCWRDPRNKKRKNESKRQIDRNSLRKVREMAYLAVLSQFLWQYRGVTEGLP
jgi:hypothetical protein